MIVNAIKPIKTCVIEYVCDECDIKFKRLTKPSRFPYRFCSKRCANKFNARDQRTYEALYRRWSTRFGEDIALKLLKENANKRSKAMTQRNMGNKLSEKTKKKISRSCTGNINALKGTTFSEFYGYERANELSRNHSKKLKEGYRTGRLKPTARSKSAPSYMGIKLRSKLEFDAIKYLEASGLIFGESLVYESKTTKTQWYDDKNIQHTYTPDLYDVVNNVVYEVKPAWKVLNESDEMKSKRLSVQNAGYEFRYLTDKDILKNEFK